MLCQAYLTHLPRQFMRVVAGFSASAGDYFLARAAHEPPAVLQTQLWPWIEEWELRFEARARRLGWAQGGLDEDDLAADGFLKLMRRLRTILLQDLAVLQPRYPSLPFYSYAPFTGPEWAAFALLVQADGAASAPQSLLLQRALPELSSVLESTREALLHNSTRLANRLEGRLEGLQGSLNVLLQGQLAGHQASLNALLQGQLPVQGQTPMPMPMPMPAGLGLGLAAAASPPSAAPAPGPPVYTELAKVYTVRDAWREWREGLAGRPAVRELEEAWGSCWRPGNTVRVQFCRRKVLWDEVAARVARGRTEEEAVTELELLRAGRGLNQLVDELKHRRQYRPALSSSIRGQGRAGRWALYGRRGGLARRQATAAAAAV